MNLRLVSSAAFLLACQCAQADIVALWDYNTSSTKHTQSANGASFSTVGGVTTTFAGGVSGQALNTTTYAAQGAGSLTRGVQYMIDTSGYTDLVFSFAQRNSNTASAYTTLRYTLDAGTTWTTATSFLMPSASSTTFVGGITYNFGSITGANDNPEFGVQLLASFAPGGSTYLPTSGASYGASGTIRYDNVLLSGTAIPETPPVPEPESYALMLAGLAAVSLVARRRHRG